MGGSDRATSNLRSPTVLLADADAAPPKSPDIVAVEAKKANRVWLSFFSRPRDGRVRRGGQSKTAGSIVRWSRESQEHSCYGKRLEPVVDDGCAGAL